MTNPFRHKIMRRHFDAAVQMYRSKHRDMFTPQGVRRSPAGNSFASYFWRGYDDLFIDYNKWDRASRRMLAYAFYRAGNACRLERLAGAARS